jgi:rhodanese-related sulfurtransferase
LIDLLAQGERSVEELARESAMSVANTSQHLQALKSARLVSVRREGPYAHYRLAEVGVFQVWQAIRDFGEKHLAEIERLVESFATNRDQREPVSTQELAERLRTGGTVVLDVRPEIEFRAGHIRGACSIPLQELEARLDELPKDQEVIAYCRGPFCVFADEAVALLRRHGFRARRFELGFPDWRAAGLPSVRR